MFEISIQKKSVKLNKRYYLKSFCILLCAILLTGLFSVLPYFLKKLLELNLINNPFSSAYLDYNTIIFAFLILSITFFALMFYSAISIGENAWYSGHLYRKKQCLKRLIFWLKPKFSLKALKLNVLLFFIKAVIFFTFCLPSLILLLTAITLAFSGGIEVYLLISFLAGTFTLFLTGVIFAFIVNQRYFLSKYLLAENPKLGVAQVLKQSKNLMNGQIFRVVKFKLSFMPAFILYLLVFPTIFLHPHYKQCCCIIANELRL